MTASMQQVAEECLKDDKEVTSTPDGLQNATKTIESGEPVETGQNDLLYESLYSLCLIYVYFSASCQ